MCHVYHALTSFKVLSKAIISKKKEFLIPNCQLFKINWQGSNYFAFFIQINCTNRVKEQGTNTRYKSLSFLYSFFNSEI